MRYRTIPGTDLTVSALCLGTAHIGTRLPAEEAFRLLDAFVEAGGTFIDTARSYADWVPGGLGASESALGRWLHDRGHQDRIVVATKGGHPAWARMDVMRLSRSEVVEDCLASRRALGLEVLPLYWLHRDDPARPLEEIFATMEHLRTQGYIRHYAFSNWSTARMRAAIEYQSRHGITGFVANQPMWSYAVVNEAGIPDATSYAMDAEMAALHRDTGMAAVAYTAQAKGLFAKWQAADPAGLPPALAAAYDNPANRARMTKLSSLSAESGLTVAVLALMWLTSQPEVPTIPIVGARTPAQWAEIMAAGDLVLPPEVVRWMAMDDLGPTPLPTSVPGPAAAGDAQAGPDA